MTTRISKIARLPISIRNELNTRIHNGEFGRKIVPWLNSLPETKQILAENFAGTSITHQNLSEWRRRGYQDWLLHQERRDWFDHFTEYEDELQKHDGGNDTYEAMSRILVYEFGQSLRNLQTIKDPKERTAQLLNLTREFSRLQNSYNWSRRCALEYDKFNGPEEVVASCPCEPDRPDARATTETPREVPSDASNVAQPSRLRVLEASRLQSPDAPRTSEVEDQRVSPTLGAPASRWPVPIVPPEPEAQRVSPATTEKSSTPLPLSVANSSTLNSHNSQPPKEIQPLPNPTPTAPQPAFPSIPQPIVKQTNPIPKYKNLYTRTRGRGFTCIEG